MAAYPIPGLWLPLTVAPGTSFGMRRDVNQSYLYRVYLTAGTYEDPANFCEMVRQVLASQAFSGHSVGLDGQGRIVIDHPTKPFNFTTDYGIAGLALLGITQPPSTFAERLVGDRTLPVLWTPGIPVAYDSFDYPLVESTLQVTLDGHHQRIVHGGHFRRDIEFSTVPAWKAVEGLEVPEHIGESFTRFWRQALSGFRWVNDITNRLDIGAAYYLVKPDKEWMPKRHPKAPFYSFKFTFGQVPR